MLFDFFFGFMTQSDGAEHWNQPNVNTVKVNTDAALFEDSGQYSFSMISRNHVGDLLEARVYCKQGSVTPEMAEAIGAKKVLSWVKNERWTETIELKTDCLPSVQAIRCSSVNLSYFGGVVSKKLLSELGGRNVILNFVKRFVNVAHYLARHTSSLTDRTWTHDDINPEFLLVILDDLKY